MSMSGMLEDKVDWKRKALGTRHGYSPSWRSLWANGRRFPYLKNGLSETKRATTSVKVYPT